MLLVGNPLAPLGARLRVCITLGLILSIILPWIFLRTLLRTPTRTPLLVLSSTYAPPWDINPCAEKNVELLQKLDGRSYSVKTLEDANRLSKGQWGEFEDKIAWLDHAAAPDKPLLIYLNLHGVVDEQQQPCFLVRDSQPFDPSTWIPLQTLIDHITRASRIDRSIVLFLECGRQAELVPSKSENTPIATALQRSIARHCELLRGSRIAVFASTSSTETSVTPWDGQADPFSRFLVQGLSGQCDLKRFGGNSDREIQLSELHDFVQQRTADYAKLHRGLTQTTFLNQTHSDNSAIAWAGRGIELPLSTPPDATSQEVMEIEQAWSELRSLQQSAAWNRFPAQWAEMKRLIVAMESSAFAGSPSSPDRPNYQQRFRQLSSNVRQAINQQANSSDNLDLQIAESTRKVWQAIQIAPSRETCRLSIEKSNVEINEPIQSAPPFLLELSSQDDLAIWRNTPRLAEYAKLAERLERIRIVRSKVDFPHLFVDQELEIDRLRRVVEDQILADVVGQELDSAFLVFSEAIDQWDENVTTTVSAYESMLVAFTELSWLAQAIDAIQSADATPITSNLVGRFEFIVESLISNVGLLRSMSNSSMSPSLIDVGNELRSIDSELGSYWRTLLSDPARQSPRYRYVLEQLLVSGILPNSNEPTSKSVQLRLETHKKLLQATSASSSLAGTEDQVQPTKKCEQTSRRLLVETLQRLTPTSNTTVKPSNASSLWSRVERVYNLDADTWMNSSYANAFILATVSRIVTPRSMDEDGQQIVNTWTASQYQSRLIESSRRTLDDFWKSPLFGLEPYFSKVSGQMITLAEKSKVGLNSTSLSELKKLREQRIFASRNAVTISSRTAPFGDLLQDSSVLCEIKPTSSALGLPVGSGVLRAKKKQGNFVEIAPRMTIPISGDIGPQSLKINFSVNGASAKNTASLSPLSRDPMGSSSQVSLAFRGHTFDYQGAGSAGPTPVVIAEKPTEGPSTIFIQGHAQHLRAKTLIVDCSASMVGPQNLESASQNTPVDELRHSKLSAARLAIREILQRWKGSSDHVGVIFFGHRITEGTPEQGSLFQDRYFRVHPFSQSLRAFEDVETILPLGRFGDVEYAKVLERMDLLLPWGQTPLYLSIQQALVESHGLDPNASHDIIVISDGKNYQFNPSPEKNVAIESIIAQAKEQRARIHVIGFGVPEAEFAIANAQFERLAQETGGSSTMEIGNAVDLIRHVEAIVQPDQYLVRSPSGESWIGQPDRLLNLSSILQPNTPIWIEYRNQRQYVPISPRSAIRLNSSPDHRLISLGHQTAGEPTVVSILNAQNSPSPFELGIHRPKRQGRGWEWEISLQRPDGQVPQRPRFVWLEISTNEQPSVQNSNTPPSISSPSKGAPSSPGNRPMYRVSDDSWQAETSVPVLHFETENWPEDSLDARLQFWCTDNPPPSLGAIPVRWDSTRQSLDPSTPMEGTLADRTLRYEITQAPSGWILTLLHAPDDDRFDEVSPQIFEHSSGLRIERTYDESSRASLHRFILANSPTTPDHPAAILEFNIQVLDMHSVKQDGLRLLHPAIISLQPPLVAHPSSQPPTLVR